MGFSPPPMPAPQAIPAPPPAPPTETDANNAIAKQAADKAAMEQDQQGRALKRGRSANVAPTPTGLGPVAKSVIGGY